MIEQELQYARIQQEKREEREAKRWLEKKQGEVLGMKVEMVWRDYSHVGGGWSALGNGESKFMGEGFHGRFGFEKKMEIDSDMNKDGDKISSDQLQQNGAAKKKKGTSSSELIVKFSGMDERRWKTYLGEIFRGSERKRNDLFNNNSPRLPQISTVAKLLTVMRLVLLEESDGGPTIELSFLQRGANGEVELEAVAGRSNVEKEIENVENSIAFSIPLEARETERSSMIMSRLLNFLKTPPFNAHPLLPRTHENAPLSRGYPHNIAVDQKTSASKGEKK
jgi:hypothetical protein